MTVLDERPAMTGHGSASGAPRVERLLPLLETLERNLDVTADPSLGPQVHWRPEGALHRWVKYREAYSPALLDSLQIGRRVTDPFAGSGSIMIGAAQSGRVSTGIDLNPLATFATRVKLTPLSSTELLSIRRFAQSIERSASRHEPWPMPELGIATKAFEPDILAALLQTRRAIAEGLGDTPAGRFVLLAWIAIFEKVGNYFKEGNGIKYRNKLRRPGSYADRVDGEWQHARFGNDQRSHYFRELRAQLGMMLDDTEVWERGTWADQIVHEASARALDTLVGHGSQDSVIFSPPYANRFDYFESYKFELWFGGFVSSAADMQRLRKRSMRSHLGADLRAPARLIEPLEELIDQMDTTTSAWRMGVPALMRGYFDDLGDVLERSARVLAPGGRCFVVVGNSAFSGVIFPVDVLAARLARDSGFRSARVVTTRHLTVAPQQRAALTGLERFMRESVVVFER